MSVAPSKSGEAEVIAIVKEPLINRAIASIFRDHGDPAEVPANVDRFASYFRGGMGCLSPLSDTIRLSGVTVSHQNTPLHVEIGKRTENLKARRVLRQAPIADLGETKNPLDDQQRMLALRPHA